MEVTSRFFTPYDSHRVDDNTDTTNFAKTTILHSTTDTTTTNINAQHTTHHTTYHNVANSGPTTHFNASKHLSFSSEGTSPLYFKWRVFFSQVTVVSSELLAKQRKGQGPCTLALRAQRELTEPVITVVVIDK